MPLTGTDEITYLGYERNGRAVEEWLGGAFETHLPRRDEIVFHGEHGEELACAGDKLRRGPDNVVSVRMVETDVDDLTDAGCLAVWLDLGMGYGVSQVRMRLRNLVRMLDIASPDWPQRVLGLPPVTV